MGKKSIRESLFNKKTFTYSIITLIIASCILFILLNKYTGMEEFSPLSIEYSEKKALSRTKLQCLINEYESTDNCKQGYIQPSNSCTYSFNTNFYPQ